MPSQIGPYRRIRDFQLSKAEIDLLLPTDSFQSIYVGPDKSHLVVSMLYWQPRNPRGMANRDIGGRLGPHHPDVCYPKAGWIRCHGLRDDDCSPAWLQGNTLQVRHLTRDGIEQVICFWQSEQIFVSRRFRERLEAMIQTWKNPRLAFVRPVYAVTLGVPVTGTAEKSLAMGMEFAENLAPLLPGFGLHTPFGP
jgi:hypothetical protein